MEKRGFGFDFKGVILANTGEQGSKWYSDAYRSTPQAEGAFVYLREFVSQAGAENVHLITGGSAEEQEKIRQWLVNHDFHRLTRIPEENVRFVGGLTEYAQLCRTLGVTSFVSSHLGVLGNLYGGEVKNLILYRPNSRNVEEFKYFYTWVEECHYWSQVLKLLGMSVSDSVAF